MEHFFDWFRNHIQPQRPWLILGKGPTFERRSQFDLGAFQLLSLNHVVREQPVLVAHMIDLDVVRACEEVLERHARVVVLPWFPHVDNRVGSRSLAAIVPEVPVLGRLQAQGRLLWYDLSTSPVRHGPGPVVEATFFSAEAAVSLLARAGATRVRSLGVDGGASYSTDFRDLHGQTLLTNGHDSFDLQFQGIARTILRTGVDFAPLTLPTPARLYVAARAADALPLALLEFSVRSRASATVEFVRVPEGGGTASLGPGGVGAALGPYSLCHLDLRRWWGAELAPEEIVLFEDGGRALAGVMGHAVPEPDRAELARLLRSAESPRPEERLRSPVRRVSLPAKGHDAPPAEPALVTYSEPGMQPWLSRAHPSGHLWTRELFQAIDQGHITPGQVAAEVARGHVRPSLLYQIRHRRAEAMLLPRAARRADRNFRVPGGGPVANGTALVHPVHACHAAAREMRRIVRAWRAERVSRSLPTRATGGRR